jgi:branched-subunit amino acid transport protein
MDTLYAIITIAGLVACTLITRGFFIIPERALELPPRVKQALRYAPIAALVAVIAPEIALTTTSLGPAWIKLIAAALAAGYFFWRRGILGTIVVGMSAYWLLRFGLPQLGIVI